MTRAGWAAALAGLGAAAAPLAAQGADSLATLTVRAVVAGEPAPGVTVRTLGPAPVVGALTDERGAATLRLAPGGRTLLLSRVGLRPDTLRLTLRARQDTSVTRTLLEREEALAAVVVTATRGSRTVEDEPTRVEVLAQEELEEKLYMTPGDIAMLLSETTGLRVQNTSPSLGGANVRIQGLRGRYTQLLSDGLPLYGGQTGSLGLLQIPPLDLGQVEVIRGVASALYGSAALGGVVNLVSRRAVKTTELLANGTSRGGGDLAFWHGDQPSARFGYTVLAGAHGHRRRDLDGDGWTDMPGYERLVVRPRLFWDPAPGRSLLVTGGATLEERRGGTLAGAVAPDGAPYPEGLGSERYDVGAVGRALLGELTAASVRVSATAQAHRHQFGERLERDRHTTLFGEASVTRAGARQTAVAGVAVQQERYRARDVGGFDYTFTAPALFAQYDLTPVPWLTATASGRVDEHSEYGTLVSPRLALLLRGRGERLAGWSVRASAGGGSFAPSPFVEETEVTGLAPLVPLQGLRAERAQSGSVDLSRVRGGTELRASLFGSRVRRALLVRDDGDSLTLTNAALDTRTGGAELLTRVVLEDFTLTATYTYVRSTEEDPDSADAGAAGPARRAVPLTPRHSVGAVASWEREGRSRLGLELYLTGRQPLADNPYRAESPPYALFGVLVERRVGRARLFANVENLFNVRLTRVHPLVRPTPLAGERWTTDAWGPLDGRVANAGVRWAL